MRKHESKSFLTSIRSGGLRSPWNSGKRPDQLSMSLQRNTSNQLNATLRKLKPGRRFSRHTTWKRPSSPWRNPPDFGSGSFESGHSTLKTDSAPYRSEEHTSELQ